MVSLQMNVVAKNPGNITSLLHKSGCSVRLPHNTVVFTALTYMPITDLLSLSQKETIFLERQRVVFSEYDTAEFARIVGSASCTVKDEAVYSTNNT